MTHSQAAKRIPNHPPPPPTKKRALTKCQVSGRKCQQVTSQAANGQPAKTGHMSPRDLCTGAARQQTGSIQHERDSS